MNKTNKILLSLLVAVVAVFGYYSLTHQATVSPKLGDGVSQNVIFVTPNNASTTVGLTSTLVTATSTSRMYVNVYNDSSNVVYLSIGQPAVLGKGIRLAAGGNYELKPNLMFTPSIFAISTATSNVSFIESK